jgi:deazaflavin-dependent oxidoreductase (nitroreductase family)
MSTPENQSLHIQPKPKGFAVWFMNALMNPLVGLILCSPLHRLMSGSVALITVRGRKSGKAYTLPVQYVQSGQITYILPGAPERKTWWRNLIGGAPVILWLHGHNQDAQAELLTGATNRAAIIDALNIYYRRFPASARSAQVQAAPDGSFSAAELAALAVHTVVVRITSTMDGQQHAS